MSASEPSPSSSHNVGQAGSDTEARMGAEDINALYASLDTGDLVLFNRKCLSMSMYGAFICASAKFVSRSKWDHIGVVVRDNDGGVKVLEATLTGVKLRPISQRVSQSQAHDIVIRKLKVERTAKMRETVSAFVEDILHRPYKTSSRALLNASMKPATQQERKRLHSLLTERQEELGEIETELTQRNLTIVQRRMLKKEKDRLQKQVEALRTAADSRSRTLFENEEDLSSVFCSELVAAVYQRLGLLPSYPPSSTYVPPDFSSQRVLPLLKGADFDADRYVRLSEKMKRTLQSNRLAVPSADVHRESLMKALQHNVLFRRIKDSNLKETLAKSFDLVNAVAGQTLVIQGGYDDKYYIIEEGECEVLVSNTVDGPEMSVGTLVRGNSFGELSLLSSGPRPATIRVCSRGAKLWCMTRDRFQRVVSIDAELVETWKDKRRIKTIIQKHPLFQHLDDERQQAKVIDAFMKVRYGSGEEIMRQGDLGNYFYIIESGECEILRSKPTQSTQVDSSNGSIVETGQRVAFLKEGDTFGEVSLLYNTPRGATVRTRGPVTVWAMDRTSFQRLSASGSKYLHKIFTRYSTTEKDGQSFIPVSSFLRAVYGQEYDSTKPLGRIDLLLLELLDPSLFDKASKCDSTHSIDSRGTPKSLASDSYLNSHASSCDLLGMINFSQFVHLDLLMCQKDNLFDVAFTLMDANKSGRLTRQDIEIFISRYLSAAKGSPVNFEFPRSTALKYFGPKSDQAVYFDEFMTLCRSGRAPPELKEFIDILSADMTEVRNKWAVASAHQIDNDTTVNTTVPQPASASLKFAIYLPLAAATARTVTAPLERLKILIQTNEVYRRVGIAGGFTKMIREDGFRSLFRGNLCNVLRSVPAFSVQLLCFDRLRALQLSRTDKEELSMRESLAIGGIAGIIANTVTYPLDVLKLRMTVQSKTVGVKYTGLWDCMKQMYREEGLKSFTRGVSPALLYIFPYIGANFAVYHAIRPYILTPSTEKPDASRVIACGAIASVVGQTIAYPMDVVRRQMQLPKDFGGNASLTFSQTLKNVLFVSNQAERSFSMTEKVVGSIRSSYRGLLVNYLKAVPSVAVSVYAYEQFKRIW